jgi:hypothetical protein
LILFVDQQTNGVQATGNQVIASGTGSNRHQVQNMHQSVESLGRFRILKDKQMIIQNPNFAVRVAQLNPTPQTMAQNGLHKPFKMTYRFKKPLLVNFNAGNAGTVADIVDNSLHLIGHADEFGMDPVIDYISRVTYFG